MVGHRLLLVLVPFEVLDNVRSLAWRVVAEYL
jgi:hypothetical protein